MARDFGSEQLLEEHLGGEAGLADKFMFGGRAWLLNGNLLCAARDDGVLVRLGKDRDRWALELAGIEPMINAGRRMTGWVRVDSETFGDDALRRKLLDAAIDFVRSLPAK